MAKFNPDTQIDLGQDQTGRSRGTESSLKAVGVLFEGLGETFGNYVKARDTEIRTDIQRTADEGVNSELSTILGSEPQKTNTPTQNVPPEVTDATSKMARFKSAYDQGKLSDLHFYGQVANLSKSLRSKYPGYSDLVDDALSAAIGTNPANRIRQELQAEFNSGSEKMSQEEKWWKDYVKQNEGEIAAVGEDVGSIDYTDKKKLSAIQNKVSVYKGQREQINGEKARLELGNAQDAATRRQAKQLATNDMNGQMRNWFNTQMNPVWQEYQTAFKLAGSKDSPGGKKLTPEERTTLAASFAKFKADVSLRAEGFLTQADEKGFSYSSYMSKTERDDVKDIVLGQVDIYEKLLTDENFGLFNLIAEENKARQEGYTNDLMMGKYGDTLANIKLLMASGVDINLINDMMTSVYTDAGWMDIKSKIASQALGVQTMSGANNNMGEYIQEQRRDPTLPPKYYDKVIQQQSDLLALPNQDPQIIANAAKSIYKTGDDDILMKQFAGLSRNQVFLRLTRPEITANLKGTEEFDRYAQWSQKQFGVIGKSAVNEIMANGHVAKWVNIQYDPANAQFKYTITPSVINQALQRGPLPQQRSDRAGQPAQFSADAASLKKVQQSLDFLNMYGARLKEISDAGNMDANETLKALYQGLGVQPDVLNQNTIVGKMFEALMTSDAQTPEPPGSTGDQSSSSSETGTFASFISGAEGAETGTMFGGTKLPLDKMTVAEVQALQKTWGRTTGSSAAGKYQVMQKTLKGLIEEGVVSPEDTFDDATQDKIFSALMERRGLLDYKAGKISKEQFAQNLSQEWASLPKDAGGKSFYQGDKMGNKATVSWKKFVSAIDTI